MGKDFPLETADPEALRNVSFKARIQGSPTNVSISDGSMELDQSKVQFSAKAKEFSKPDLSFDMRLDKIDVDRYLPPPGEKEAQQGEKKAEVPAPKRKKADYGPLRKPVLDASIRVGELKAKGARMQDLHLKVTAKNGRYHVDPFKAALYQGKVLSTASLDVRKETPRTDLSLRAEGIQASPLLKDLIEKDFLEGTAELTADIRMTGDEPEKIKRTLNGKGSFHFKDGAIVGIDLPGMVRNVKGAFGLGEKKTERPRTDFSELQVPFTLTDGVFRTPEAFMASPLIRVLASGKANLVKETLDFRVEPKFVATLKGQNDSQERGGLKVPVLVSGTFARPEFRPDMKGMLQETLEKGVPETLELKKMLKEGNEKGGETKPPEERVKDLLKGFGIGR
jgi:AsmA protein